MLSLPYVSEQDWVPADLHVRNDAAFYADYVIRAAESVHAPMGWREGNIQVPLADRTDATLAEYKA